MPNPTISQITLPSGTTYDIKDANARERITTLEAVVQGGVHFIGKTTSAIVDGSTTNPVTIEGKGSFTAVAGDIVTRGSNAEYIFDGTKWLEFGDLSGLKALAYKDSASGSYTPAGTVSKPTFTGSSSTVTITTADNTSGNYTPKGTVSQPTFTGSSSTFEGTLSVPTSVSVTTKSTTNKTATVSPASSGTVTYTPAGNNTGGGVTLKTTTVNSITAVGTLPELTMEVASGSENLTFTWNAGSLPTKGAATTVATEVDTFTQPTFTGTGVRLVTGNIAVPSAYTATLTNTDTNVSVSGTPNGSVSQPTFSGTKVQITGTTTATGSVSQPTFTGTPGTVTVS